MNDEIIKEKMKVYINGYKKGLADRDYVEEKIEHLYSNYGPFDRQEYYTLLDKIDGKQKTRPNHEEISKRIVSEINDYKSGKRDKEYLEKQIDYYKQKYHYSTFEPEIIDMLEEIGIRGIDKKYNYLEDHKESDKTLKIVFCIVLILILIGVIKFGGWLFDDTGYDSDNDGLSNDFEVEQGTDPHDYTWNFEWGD